MELLLERYRDYIRERDNDWWLKDNYKEKSGIYIWSGNTDADSIMKTTLSKIVKGQKSQECFLDEIKIDILELGQKVESYTIIIK